MKLRQISMVFFVISFALLSACTKEHSNEHVIRPFSFVNQYGEAFGTNELEGSVWIANFMFTNCTSVCPTTSMEMAKIQKELAEKDLEVELVSFTVDPENDSPERLKQYLRHYTDDDSNWHLLTGYTQAEIERFAHDQFQAMVKKSEDSDQIIHSSSFYLIDQNGKIVNKYHYSHHNYLEALIKDIEKIN